MTTCQISQIQYRIVTSWVKPKLLCSVAMHKKKLTKIKSQLGDTMNALFPTGSVN